MRPGYYQGGETIVNGYWHHSKIDVGEMYQMRKSQQWMVVLSVEYMRGPDDNNWFCTLRPATAEEIAAIKPVNPKAEKKMFSDFFDAIDNA